MTNRTFCCALQSYCRHRTVIIDIFALCTSMHTYGSAIRILTVFSVTHVMSSGHTLHLCATGICTRSGKSGRIRAGHGIEMFCPLTPHMRQLSCILNNTSSASATGTNLLTTFRAISLSDYRYTITVSQCGNGFCLFQSAVAANSFFTSLATAACISNHHIIAEDVSGSNRGSGLLVITY